MRKVASNADIRVKDFGPTDYIKITIFGFALAALWSSLHTIVIQLRLLDFVAEAQKNTYLGLLTGTGLILAMAIQPIAGAISDRSGFRWGRRRPYILLGTVLTILFLPGIGLCDSYLTLFIAYCLLQVSSNTALGPHQAFIPDLVPEKKRGRASGVKTLFELVGGLVVIRLIAYLMDRYFTEQGGPWLGYTLAILGVALLVTMLATILTVREQPGAGGAQFPSWSTLCRSFKIDIKANRDFAWFLVSRLLILTSFSALQKFALYFLMDVVGISSPAAVTADLLIVVGVCMLVTVYPTGRLSDKIGRKLILVSAGLVGALGIMLLFFAQSYVYILLCGAILGISFGAFMGTNWALATDLVAKGEEARYLGLTNLATAGGSALTLLIIGPMIDFFNAHGSGLGYQVMFLVCFTCLVIGSLLVLKIKGRAQLK
ncbi:MFS transporter [Chloroflexota bacterium]